MYIKHCKNVNSPNKAVILLYTVTIIVIKYYIVYLYLISHLGLLAIHAVIQFYCSNTSKQFTSKQLINYYK